MLRSFPFREEPTRVCDNNQASLRPVDSAQRCFERCARRWPNLVIDQARFVAHVRACSAAVRSDINEDHLDDLYLALACGDGSPEAVEIFEQKTTPRARAAVGRIDRRPEFVDEVLRASRSDCSSATKRRSSATGVRAAWWRGSRSPRFGRH